MNNIRRITTWLLVSLVLSLMAAIIVSAPAFAQDEAPAEPLPQEVPAEIEPAEEAPVEAVPGPVEIVTTSLEGEVLPLASEEAATALASGDPWWKVGTVTYRFLSGISPSTCALVDPLNPYCFENPNPIQASIAYIMINDTAVPTDGKLYVEAGAYVNEDITIAGTSGNLGKLKGLIGHLSPTTNLPDAVLTNSTIIVGNMTGPFLLSGFNITADMPGQVVSFQNNSGAMTMQDMVVTNPNTSLGAAAIRFVQTGAVTLTRVDSSGNGENAVYIENDSGTALVSITNASFDDNNGTASAALTIISNGAITLNNVSVARNDTTGVSINSLKSLVVKNCNFHHNAGDGLSVTTTLGTLGAVTLENVYLMNNVQDGGYISMGGTVTIKNVMADNNARFGMVINTCGSDPCDMAGVGTVTINNSSFNKNQTINTINHWAGLSILAKGAITLTNVTASGNGYYTGVAYSKAYGVYLNNQQAVSSANISLTQSVFDGNFWSGLAILTKGSVKLNTISASSNGISAAPDWQIYGMDIDADEGSGSVTLTSTLGDSFFDNNDGTGIRVFAKGNVSLTGKAGWESSSSSNGTGANGYGISVDNTAGLGSVTIKNFDLLANQVNGLRVRSHGAITLDSLDVNNNGVGAESIGADIANDSAPSAKAVIITASNFQGNNGEGLHVYTKGSVTLNGINASSNTSGTSNPCGAFISADYGVGSVTLLSSKGVNSFAGNDGSGLIVYTNGKVSIDTVSAYNNGTDDGVYISTTTAGDVVVKKLESYYNGNSGLFVSAFGNITVDNTYIYGNGLADPLYSGAYLYNAGGTLAKTVTVTRSAFFETPTTGLIVDSRGLITLNNVSAYDNTLGGGVFLQNDYASSIAGVSVLSSYGVNAFENNEGHGFEIQTNGSVMMSKIVSATNHGDGVHVLNTGGTGSVTIIKGSFFSNYGSAIFIQSNGKISISDVTADGNGVSYGGAALTLHNGSHPTLEPPVTIIRTEIANQPDTGIAIGTKGVITLNSVTSSHNTSGGMGVSVDNSGSTKNAGILILSSYGRNDFSSNASYGLYLISDGTITISKADVLDNGSSGAYLDNDNGTGSVIITDSYFDGNPYSAGIQIFTYGKLTWTGGGASYNGYLANGTGVFIDNSLAPNPMTVSISKAQFNKNAGEGIFILAQNQITLNGVTADENAYGGFTCGAYLDNSSFSGGVSVLSSYGPNSFYGNEIDGLVIRTSGTVILSKVTANGNGSDGINVDNTALGSTSAVSFTIGNLGQNMGYGAYIVSNGAVTLSGITASVNGYLTGTGDGVFVNNNGGNKKTITITRSFFTGNDGNGLYLVSDGAVTLNAIQAVSNIGFGIEVDNHYGTGKVDLLGTMGANIFHDNIAGVYITSAGVVTVGGTTAYNNSVYGIYAENSSGTGNAMITGANVHDNSNIGVYVVSSGLVSIINSKVDDNVAYGARIINTADTSGTKGVTVKSSSFSRTFGGRGLSIDTHGPVVIYSIKADDNGEFGAIIDNVTGTITGTPTVTVSGVNSFNNNSLTGLFIDAKGAISLANITSLYNDGDGMNLSTDAGGSITVTNATLKQNRGYGIYALSGGTITISGMLSLFNGIPTDCDGAYLNATGYDINIKNSAINANGRIGLNTNTGLTHTLYLTGVYYFGNDFFGGAVNPDLVFNGYLVLN